MADQPTDDETAAEIPDDEANEVADRETGEVAGGVAEAPSLSIESQYIKDLSFENLSGHAALEAVQHNPDVKIEVSANARPLDGDRHEVTLFFRAEAMLESGETLFIAELTYAGAFRVGNVPQHVIPQLLLINGAFLLFPFARSVLAQVTRDGGFPPLMINPMDFAALYEQNKVADPAPDGGNGLA
jgi:preprotein translocase subunit SecB